MVPQGHCTEQQFAFYNIYFLPASEVKTLLPPVASVNDECRVCECYRAQLRSVIYSSHSTSFVLCARVVSEPNGDIPHTTKCNPTDLL